jgi:hypothetical protein
MNTQTRGFCQKKVGAPAGYRSPAGGRRARVLVAEDVRLMPTNRIVLRVRYVFPEPLRRA